MGTFIRHIPCSACGSRDNRALYAEGNSYCFGCQKWFPPEGDEGHTMSLPEGEEDAPGANERQKPLNGSFRDIPNRKLREETCRKYGYMVGDAEHLAHYYDENRRWIATKVRKAGKKFSVAGDGKNMPLYGQWLFSGGKSVVITEGEIDALSVSQAFDNKWAAVSLPNGAQSAVRAITGALEWLDTFENIVLCFDNDEPGREATAEVAQVLPIGKVKIMTLPEKDANETLVKHGAGPIVKAFYNARDWRPDGIVRLADLREKAKRPVEWGLPWCFDGLTQGTFGRREGEVYTFGAGTGVGKTDLLTQQITFDAAELKQPVGVIFLEQPNVETVRRLAGKLVGRAFHVPDNSWTQEEYEEAVDRLADLDNIHLYNHFGVSDWAVIKQRIRYMRQAYGIRLIYLDHLTALADPSKERETLETIMAELAGMSQELGLIVHLVSHLSTPEGKSHEEGGKVSLRHFKGARAIGFWTFYAFGLERDKNSEDPAMKNVMTMRCLKDRGTGRFDGERIYLRYDHTTCRLTEVPQELVGIPEGVEF
jgi:twinkle protein